MCNGEYPVQLLVPKFDILSLFAFQPFSCTGMLWLHVWVRYQCCYQSIFSKSPLVDACVLNSHLHEPFGYWHWPVFDYWYWVYLFLIRSVQLTNQRKPTTQAPNPNRWIYCKDYSHVVIPVHFIPALPSSLYILGRVLTYQGCAP